MAYKNILVAGSIAFDFLFKYDGEIKSHFEGHDLTDLSTCFFSPNRQRYFGGTGGNISYGLSLFDEEPHLVGTVGNDFEGDYKDWLSKNGVKLDSVKEVADGDTACAYIVTDNTCNQVAIFYPGASNEDYDFDLDLSQYKDSLLIISPMNLLSMIKLAKQARVAGVDYIFDPGQQITLFKPNIIEEIAMGSWAVILNDYELRLAKDMFDVWGVNRLIVTRGENGSHLHEGDALTEVGAVAAEGVVDPTGCGDAYRSGLLYGLKNGFDFKKAAQIGALAATYTIEKEGTQSHAFSLDEFKARYKESFKEEL